MCRAYRAVYRACGFGVALERFSEPVRISSSSLADFKLHAMDFRFLVSGTKPRVSEDSNLNLKTRISSGNSALICTVAALVNFSKRSRRPTRDVSIPRTFRFYVRRLLIVIPLIAMALSFASAIFINETSGAGKSICICFGPIKGIRV